MDGSFGGCRLLLGNGWARTRGTVRIAGGVAAALVICCCVLDSAAAEPAGVTNAAPANQTRQVGVSTGHNTPAPGAAAKAPGAAVVPGVRGGTDAAFAAPPLDGPESFYKKHIAHYVAEHLMVGLRVVNNKLEETSRPADRDGGRTFLGYVNELEQQDKTGVRPFVGYQFSPYFGVELSQDEVAARTRNYNNGQSDGILRMSGPVFSATLSYPVTDYLLPYAGIGYAPWSASFDHDDWWRLGYSSPESYAAAGSPNEYRSIGRRIEVEDDSATFFTLGLAIRLHRYARLDLMMRQMDLTSKASFYHVIGHSLDLQREGEFTMKHSTYGVALSLVF